jgi:hypothetical protein
MKRLVETDRWKDSFFINLHPYSKLVLSYLYDNCDDAGFIDVNYTLWSEQLKIDKLEIRNSILELKPLLLSDKKVKLFVKDFLKHQKKLPLKYGDEESEWILQKLKSNLERFNNAPEILNIISSAIDLSSVEINDNKNEEVKKRNIFKPPKYEEFEAYYLSVKPNADIDDIKNLYDYYNSCDWKVGSNKKMKDWQAAIRVCIRKINKAKFSNYKNKSQTIMSVVNELKELNN